MLRRLLIVLIVLNFALAQPASAKEVVTLYDDTDSTKQLLIYADGEYRFTGSGGSPVISGHAGVNEGFRIVGDSFFLNHTDSSTGVRIKASGTVSQGKGLMTLNHSSLGVFEIRDSRTGD